MTITIESGQASNFTFVEKNTEDILMGIVGKRFIYDGVTYNPGDLVTKGIYVVDDTPAQVPNAVWNLNDSSVLPHATMSLSDTGDLAMTGLQSENIIPGFYDDSAYDIERASIVSPIFKYHPDDLNYIFNRGAAYSTTPNPNNVPDFYTYQQGSNTYSMYNSMAASGGYWGGTWVEEDIPGTTKFVFGSADGAGLSYAPYIQKSFNNEWYMYPGPNFPNITINWFVGKPGSLAGLNNKKSVANYICGNGQTVARFIKNWNSSAGFWDSPYLFNNVKNLFYYDAPILKNLYTDSFFGKYASYEGSNTYQTDDTFYQTSMIYLPKFSSYNGALYMTINWSNRFFDPNNPPNSYVPPYANTYSDWSSTIAPYQFVYMLKSTDQGKTWDGNISDNPGAQKAISDLIVWDIADNNTAYNEQQMGCFISVGQQDHYFNGKYQLNGDNAGSIKDNNPISVTSGNGYASSNPPVIVARKIRQGYVSPGLNNYPICRDAALKPVLTGSSLTNCTVLDSGHGYGALLSKTGFLNGPNFEK